jgi:hypothetical protein
LQGASYILQKINWSKASEDTILQVFACDFLQDFAFELLQLASYWKRWPINVVTFDRDGVSEGQFYQVLLHELDAIRKVTFFFPFPFGDTDRVVATCKL